MKGWKLFTIGGKTFASQRRKFCGFGFSPMPDWKKAGTIYLGWFVIAW